MHCNLVTITIDVLYESKVDQLMGQDEADVGRVVEYGCGYAP
jgi:hypothetical protein